MVTILIIHKDAALRLTARRALEDAGFAVSEALDETCIPNVAPQLIIADAAIGEALAQRYPSARLLALGENSGFPARFTPSELLAAVRLTLARGSTRERRRRSTSRPRRPA